MAMETEVGAPQRTEAEVARAGADEARSFLAPNPHGLTEAVNRVAIAGFEIARAVHMLTDALKEMEQEPDEPEEPRPKHKHPEEVEAMSGQDGAHQ